MRVAARPRHLSSSAEARQRAAACRAHWQWLPGRSAPHPGRAAHPPSVDKAENNEGSLRICYDDKHRTQLTAGCSFEPPAFALGRCFRIRARWPCSLMPMASRSSAVRLCSAAWRDEDDEGQDNQALQLLSQTMTTRNASQLSLSLEPWFLGYTSVLPCPLSGARHGPWRSADFAFEPCHHHRPECRLSRISRKANAPAT